LNQVTKPSFGRQKSEMEGMVANYTRDYGGTNPRQFGISSCEHRNLLE